MASSIASLFGPSAEEIVYAKQQEDQARRQQQLQQNLAVQSSPLAQQFYQSGYNMFSGLGGLFGKPMMDPRLQQAVKIRQLLGSTSVEDLNDPAALSKLSQRFQDEGLAREALYFADRATSIESAGFERKYKMAKLAAETGNQTFQKDLVVKNPDGTTSNVIKVGNSYFNADTQEPVSPRDLINIARLSKETGGAGKGKESIDITKRFLASQGIDVGSDLNKVLAADINGLVSSVMAKAANEGKTISEPQARQEVIKMLTDSGVLTPGSWGKWNYDPSAIGGDKIADRKSASQVQSRKDEIDRRGDIAVAGGPLGSIIYLGKTLQDRIFDLMGVGETKDIIAMTGPNGETVNVERTFNAAGEEIVSKRRRVD
jgi:hypothetical protein